MRVIAGEKGGRRLVAPEGRRTRPTSDRVREAAFSMMESSMAEEGRGLDGAVVWDLFAGSGALGIEALSRGAARATFVDNARSAVSAMTANLARLGYSAARAKVVQADVLRWAHGLDVIDGPGRAWALRRPVAEAPGAPPDEPHEASSSTAGPNVDVVLADPPYEWRSWPALLGALATLGALVVLETASSPELPVGWHVLKARRYGGTLITLTRFDASEDEPGLRGPGGPESQ